MEDDSDRMPLAGSHLAYAMPESHAILAARSLNRPGVDGEYDGIPFAQGDHRRSRLHPWTLFGKHEFASHEILAGLREQSRYLEGKDMLPIQILMQTIIVVGTIAQQERRRPELTGVVTSIEEFLMVR